MCYRQTTYSRCIVGDTAADSRRCSQFPPKLVLVIAKTVPNESAQMQAVDATACTNGCSEMLSVLSPQDLAVVRFLTTGDLSRRTITQLE